MQDPYPVLRDEAGHSGCESKGFPQQSHLLLLTAHHSTFEENPFQCSKSISLEYLDNDTERNSQSDKMFLQKGNTVLDWREGHQRRGKGRREKTAPQAGGGERREDKTHLVTLGRFVKD